jgi:hypothetical protein
MKDSARYVKIVEWSDEDHCYVGSAPGLIYGGCQDGRPLPPATSGRDFANKMQDVA